MAPVMFLTMRGYVNEICPNMTRIMAGTEFAVVADQNNARDTEGGGGDDERDVDQIVQDLRELPVLVSRDVDGHRYPEYYVEYDRDTRYQERDPCGGEEFSRIYGPGIGQIGEDVEGRSGGL